MIALLATFILAGPAVHAADTDSEEEFSFIEEGEKNRAKVESQRAPAADLFLMDDEDEDVSTWDAPAADTAEIIDDDIDFEADPTLTAIPSYESDDPEEDMEGMGPMVGGLSPLGDHFPLNVIADGLGGVAAEIPVLVARNSADLRGDMWVVADIYADGVKVGESRHLVTPASLSGNGPTYVWIKANLPTHGPSVSAEVRLFASQPGKKEQPLFTRTATLSL
jgi:hypothetical protein